MIFIRSWLSDYLHFLITLCMILSRVLYFEYKFTLLYLRTHWRVGTSLLLRLWLDGELFSVFIGHIICSYAVRVWISLGPFDLRGRNFTITTQPKIWPGCLSRDSNPGLLRGKRESYHYTTQPTIWPGCCSRASNPGLLRGKRESYHYTTQPTIWPGCCSRASNPGLMRGKRESGHCTTKPTDRPICCWQVSNPGLLLERREFYYYSYTA